jgi:hypothetical protein
VGMSLEDIFIHLTTHEAAERSAPQQEVIA